jgi:hypothetical protein
MRWRRSGQPSDGSYRVGDKVLVTGGYDQDAEWLQGGPGYAGTIKEISGKLAAVELISEIALRSSRSDGWPNFGDGGQSELGRLPVATGSWLALTLGYVGAEWRDPIGRIHVGLCAQRPDLSRVPAGGGIGAWVESHATLRRV